MRGGKKTNTSSPAREVLRSIKLSGVVIVGGKLLPFEKRGGRLGRQGNLQHQRINDKVYIQKGVKPYTEKGQQKKRKKKTSASGGTSNEF